MTMVSIVMRTFERPVMLARAIASVQGQTFSNWHLVIVNNGGDPSVVDEVVRRASQVTLVNTGTISVLHLADRVGMEEASNSGLAATESDFFVIHDDDDSWSPRFLEVTVASLSAHETAAAVVTGITRVYETFKGGKVWPVSHEDFYLSEGNLTYRAMVGGNTFPPIAALFRRSVVDQVGAFDASLRVLGDWEFNLRAVTIGPFVYLPERLARYHTRTPDSDVSSGNSITVGEDLHRSVKLQLQDRWLAEPAVNGVNKGALSIASSVSAELDEIRYREGARNGEKVDADHIAHRTAEIINLGRLPRRIARSVLHPGHGARAVARRIGRNSGR
jgi:glycosyltransferase involved in cell wall biosynthesis